MEVTIDNNKLEKIIMNLLSNALKFTASDGDIRLSAMVKEQQLMVAVTDSGVGISEADLPRVFERFFQSSDPDKKTTGGTGIGLAFVKELVDLHNGRVTVENEDGDFVVFKVILPCEKSSFINVFLYS